MKHFVILVMYAALGSWWTSFGFDGSPIQIQITAPTNGTVLRAHQQISVAVDVIALDGLIEQVELSGDGDLLGQSSSNPFTFSLSATLLGTGVHSLSATAVDNRGNTQTSDNVQITILQPTPVVQAVYLTPSDRKFNPNYSNAITAALTNLQGWYSQQLSNGTSFRLTSPVVEFFQTPHNAAWYDTNSAGFFYGTLNDGFQLTGGSYPDADVTWLFYVDADPKGQATGGIKGVAVLHQGDLQGLVAEAGSTTKRWVGGSGHELGHAFGLPHPPGCETPEPGIPCASSALMWLGYTTYPNTFLLADNKVILNESGFFYKPSSPPQIASPKVISTILNFTAEVEIGWPYHALRSSNLVTWINYSNFVSQSSNIQINAVSSNAIQFFRVQYK